MSALSFLLLSVLLQATGQILQKHRVALRRPGISLGEAAGDVRGFLAHLAGDRLWLASFLLIIPGALFGLQAVSMMDLTVLKSLGRLETVFAVLGGALVLGESLSRREGVGVAITLVGAVLLASSADLPTGRTVGLGVHLAYLTCVAALLALLLAASHVRPDRLTPEVALGLGAGLVLGTGDVLVKGATEVVRSEGVGFNAASLGTHASLWTTPEFALALACLLTGFFLVQVAYANGRVAVLAPTSAATATVFPVLFGLVARGESLGEGRLPGLLVVALGALVLSWPRSAPPVVLGAAEGG